MNSMDWKAQIGQRLVGGFPGTELSDDFIRLVKEYKVGNVILFQRNVESRTQLRRLCDSIQKLVMEETGHPAFITIDQEGGVVTRLPKECCNVMGAMAVTATGDSKNAEILAKITARELKSLGVNFNLAPVMDVNNNPKNPVIGVRSYSDTAKDVIEYGVSALKGYQESDLLACAKHFPGHGDTTVDSHIGLPVIDKSLEELEELELSTFKAVIEHGILAVMTSHILFPKLEPNHVPCTMSRRMITGILKEQIGFEGLVLSDCMEMDAIRKYYGTANGVVEAMAAGVDLVLVSHTAQLLEEGILAVYKALEEERLSKQEMEKSAAKIIAYKQKYIDLSVLPEDCSEEDKRIEKEIRRTSITLTQGSMFELGEHPLFTGCGGYLATQVSNKEKNPETFAGYMEKKLGGVGIEMSKNPSETEINIAVDAAKKADSIILCTYNGHLQSGQLKLLQELSKLPKPMAVIALRNPYDLADLPEHVTGIAAWDNSVMTLELLEELFRGGYEPRGKLPIRLIRDLKMD